MRWVGFLAETRGVHVRPRSRQQNAIDGLQQRSNIGDVGCARKHQG
jgi:hypothetical protein